MWARIGVGSVGAALLLVGQQAAVATAQAGTLSIRNDCSPRVTGVGVFSVRVSGSAGRPAVTLRVAVPCGQTAGVPIPVANLVVGSSFDIDETTRPRHGMAAGLLEVDTTLTNEPHTVTIHNLLAGADVNLQKACGVGVSGTAQFRVSATLKGEAIAEPDLIAVACGATVTLQAADHDLRLVPVDTVLRITETQAPHGGHAATVPSVVVTDDVQTIRVVNAAVATSTPPPPPSTTTSHQVSLTRLPHTGGGIPLGQRSDPTGVPLVLVGALLAAVGVRLVMRGGVVWNRV
jgi:hypothetical protein